MRSGELEVLSALVDGERVEPEDLERALSHPEAKSFLVDCVRLREQLVREAEPRAAFVDATRRRLGDRVRTRSRRWLAAAAIAAAVVALLLSLAWPLRQTEEVLPHPDRVIRLERGQDWVG